MLRGTAYHRYYARPLKARVFLVLLGLCWFSTGGFLPAQDYNDDYQDGSEDDSPFEDSIPWETDWDGYISDLYSRGDQTFTMSAGVIFPIVFLDNNGNSIDHHFSPPVGGALGPLAYTYFLSSNFFLGGEVAFQFNNTLARNTIFFIPFGVHAGWQFIVRRFEIPLSLTVGMVPQRYLNYGYLGFFLKGAASVYFRFSPDWSFGLNTNWNWYPQWPKDDGTGINKNRDANILGLTLSARYHF